LWAPVFLRFLTFIPSLSLGKPSLFRCPSRKLTQKASLIRFLLVCLCACLRVCVSACLLVCFVLSGYNSVDIGLFHIVGLDLDPGKLGTASGEWSLWNNSVGQPDAQGTWLEQDLAAADANRKNVPWIIVTSHFPLVHTMLSENRGKSARHYVGVEGEDSLEDRPYAEHHFKDCPAGAVDRTSLFLLSFFLFFFPEVFSCDEKRPLSKTGSGQT
jgi:hypothetical protein